MTSEQPTDVRREAASAVTPEQGATTAEELAYRLRQQELTAEFGLFALKTHDVQALLQEATEVCGEGMKTRLCKVMQYQPDEGDLLMRAGVGWKPGYVGVARAGADLGSPAGYAFQTGEPVISNHLQGETRFRTPQILVDHGVKRAINVLLRSGKDKFGVLEVDSPVQGRFTGTDLAFMQGFANLLGVAIERQRSEGALRTSDAQLRQALEHQGVLTKEISHRVKNSLSIVASLLSMQARASDHDEVRRALADAENRVQTIAAVHDRLWRTEEVHSIDLAEFLGGLCQQFQAAGPEHAVSYDIAPVLISTDDAVTLGLLANELVTNAIKYTSPKAEGDIRLTLTPLGRGELRFEVRDHGPGLPAEFDTTKSKSLGMKLIARLGRQLGGKPVWQNSNPGTRFVLEFTP
ncbi:GAF domain-containing protein [Lichenibacterium minor]|uniref:histidine kinase n=1 Tax=Lichenibacterium minor TaxID=2316528 RepID=A0A4Q2TXB5_9HYPH|nr:histidine kinase dimerization/phosphoacceptor domain -containing protein [Lichenibacterium minor]RYC28749.1 GAF domain-containing protein [Lichenibacterium minor]